MRNVSRRVFQTGFATLISLGIITFLSLHPASAQTPSTRHSPTFEVVVIKPAQPDDTNWRMEFNPGTMRIENRSVRDLIEFAYDLKSDTQLLNVSGWMTSQHFDIQGKEDESLAKTLETCPLEQRRQIMRQLVLRVLEERFKLQITPKTAEVSVLALVVAKGGAKVKVADAKDGKTFRGLVGPSGKIDARGASMQLLADRLARTPEAAGRVVLDKTQMPGEYSWSLRWAPTPASLPVSQTKPTHLRHSSPPCRSSSASSSSHENPRYPPSSSCMSNSQPQTSQCGRAVDRQPSSAFAPFRG